MTCRLLDIYKPGTKRFVETFHDFHIILGLGFCLSSHTWDGERRYALLYIGQGLLQRRIFRPNTSISLVLAFFLKISLEDPVLLGGAPVTLGKEWYGNQNYLPPQISLSGQVHYSLGVWSWCSTTWKQSLGTCLSVTFISGSNRSLLIRQGQYPFELYRRSCWKSMVVNQKSVTVVLYFRMT